MLYAALRRLASFSLRRFYRVTVRGPAVPGEGPLILVGNHPNSIIDPALVFASCPRQVAFLARAPLFRVPVFGWLMRRIGALAVHRGQDGPRGARDNEGTFAAATAALGAGSAIMIFPEGRSHSDPHLSPLKTGAARIALRAQAAGAPVRVVPVGLTYADKHRFRSEVLIETGAPIAVEEYGSPAGDGDTGAVLRLTSRVEQSLGEVTLNLESWEDLPLIQTAESLYALKLGDRPMDPARLRRFARGLPLFRQEQPERFAATRAELLAFGRLLELVHTRPGDLHAVHKPRPLGRFVLRSAGALLLGLPLFLAGILLFALPYQVPRWLGRYLPVPLDQKATVKFFSTLLLVPLVWAGIALGGHLLHGAAGAALAAGGALPLALHTRYFLENRVRAFHDARILRIVGNKRRMSARLREEVDRVAALVEQAAAEYRDRADVRASGS